MDVRIFDEAAHIYLDDQNFVIKSMDPNLHDLRLESGVRVGVFGYWRYGRIFPLSVIQEASALARGYTLLVHAHYPGWQLGRHPGPMDLNDDRGQRITVSGQGFAWDLLPIDATDDDDNKALRKAAEAGQVEVVRILLQELEVDPTTKQQQAIRYAARYGWAETVKLLLADHRVDPATDDYYAMRYAAENGHAGVMQLLLQDPRVYPTFQDDLILKIAANYGQIAVLRVLLADRRFDPTLSDCYLMRWAAESNFSEAVQLLATIPGIVGMTVKHYLNSGGEFTGLYRIKDLAKMTYALSVNNEDLLIWASVYGALDLVKYLIEQGTNPACHNNSPVAAAHQFGQSEVKAYLLTLQWVEL